MIVVPRDIYDEVINHAKADVPNEACGILGGTHDEDVSRVTLAYPATNAAQSPRFEYRIDPGEQFDLMETIEEAGDDVAGFYHSHPEGPPSPSETDASRATWPGLSYVIVSLDSEYPYMGAWRWNDEMARFEQEVVRLVTNS